jgi:signal transduction histidine kinase
MTVTLLALGTLLRVRLGAELLQGIDLDLRSRAQVVETAIAGRDTSVVRTGGSLIDPDEAFAQVLDGTGRIVDTSSAVAGAAVLSALQLSEVTGPTFFTTRVLGVDDPVRLLAVPTKGSPEPLFIVVGATLGDRNEAVGRLTLLLAILGPVALLIVSGAGWLLTGAALRPIERMRREAAAISHSELDRRLHVPPANDELGRLATTLNDMLARLEEAFRREGRLVDQASHELRTPLAVLRAELDLALLRARTPEETERTLRNASRETDRLVRLAEDLTVLARVRDGRLPVRRVPVSLGPFVEQICTAYRARGELAGIEICGKADGASVRMDPSRIRQAIEGLLDNALRSTPAGGRIDIVAAAQDGTVRIEVRDSGRGFPAAMLERGIEPFAANAAGALNGGVDGERGAGLGLSIVRAVAEAHGGSVDLANDPASGANVTLTFTG